MKRFSIIPAILFALLVQAQNEPTHFIQHTVEWDETIYSIPVHYSISTKDFLSLNHFTSDVKLSEGQSVIIRPMTPGEVLSLNKSAIEERNTATNQKQVDELKPINDELLTSKKEMAQQQPVMEKKEPLVILTPTPVAVAQVAEAKPIIAKREKAIQAFNEAPVAKADKGSFVNEDLGPNGISYKISSNGFHQVEKKQTFYHIALIYGLTVDELKKINNMASTDIAIGQKLRISM